MIRPSEPIFRRHSPRPGILALILLLAAFPAFGQVIPTTFEVFGDLFEGTDENWVVQPGSVVSITSGAGFGSSSGLEVTVSQSKSHLTRGGRRELARAEEAYFSFWFNPNNVNMGDPGSGFIPDRALQVAVIKGPDFKNMVALRVRKNGGNYEGFLLWRANDRMQFDHNAGTFALSSGWQRITIGFRSDDWVGCWIDGANVRHVTGVDHLDPYGSVLELGHTLDNSVLNPSGAFRFDEASFHLPTIGDLWVDQATGNDSNDGLTSGTAFATIGRASDLAGAGTTVHILPGLYRESIVPAQGGGMGSPAVYRAENGLGTVTLRGSVPSADLSWSQLGSNTIGLPAGVTPSDVWMTDLSAWNLAGPPLFLVQTAGGEITGRLPEAREPDWTVTDPIRPTKGWWHANGGSFVPGCDPATDPDPECDASSRDDSQLTDDANDSGAGAEPGNLTTLGNLTGATIIARDWERGHFTFRREITFHNPTSGRVTVDASANRVGAGDPGLGWGSEYYLVDHPGLLDHAGEWWYDDATGKLYLWPPSSGNPANQNLEISRHDYAFDLKDRSYVTLEALEMELYNGDIVSNDNWVWHRALGNRVTGSRLRYGHRGVLVSHPIEAGSHADKTIEEFEIVGNEISEIDHEAIRVTQRWNGGSSADTWTRSAVFDTAIRNNTLSNIGYRPEAGSDSNGSLVVRHGDRITIEGNMLSDVYHDGILFSESVVQSGSTWGFSSSEIKIGEILVKDNLVERACLAKGDCGAIRIWGVPPHKHVFRDFLLIGNEVMDSRGWNWAAEKRRIYEFSLLVGAGGNGFYFDNTSGFHAFRNVSYNNTLTGFFIIKKWRDGRIVLYNNAVVENSIGIRLGGLENDTHADFDTRVRNNIVANNKGYGLVFADLDFDFTNTLVNRNLYNNNGWGGLVFKPGILNIVHESSQEHWPTLPEVQANTSFEAVGQSASPSFVDFNPNEHDPLDGSRPDFRLSLGSAAIDAGTSSLPSTLADLLTLFALEDGLLGPAFDQGAFEGAVGSAEIFADGFDTGGLAEWTTFRNP